MMLLNISRGNDWGTNNEPHLFGCFGVNLHSWFSAWKTNLLLFKCHLMWLKSFILFNYCNKNKLDACRVVVVFVYVFSCVVDLL